MSDQDPKRKSHCIVCGKRLSEKTESGSIRWHIGHVDDSGIYCETCFKPKKGNKGKKRAPQQIP